MVGTEIKTYLKEYGLKQTSIAEKMNMPIQTFNAILNEQRKLETEEYFKLCEVLEVSVDYFAIKCGYVENYRKNVTKEVSLCQD